MHIHAQGDHPLVLHFLSSLQDGFSAATAPDQQGHARIVVPLQSTANMQWGHTSWRPPVQENGMSTCVGASIEETCSIQSGGQATRTDL